MTRRREHSFQGCAASLILCVLFSFSFTLYAREAGSRIIDGTQVSASQFPTVGVVGSTNGLGGSGTLISPRHVLTAAHCVTDEKGIRNVANSDGRFVLNGIVYSTTKIDVHPSWQGISGFEGQVDLAIMTLAKPVDGATPSPLYRQAPVIGQLLTIAGYGYLGTGAVGIGPGSPTPASGMIAFGTTTIDALSTTFIYWVFEDKPIPNKESNTAPGDSGGPAFVTVGGVLYLAGVTGGGSLASAAFGDRSFDTRVDAGAAWIDSIIIAPVEVPPVFVPPSKADVVVERLEFASTPAAGLPATLYVKISNTGLASAGQFLVAAFLNQQAEVSNSTNATARQVVPSLAPGVSINVSLSLVYPSTGDFHVAAFADSENSLNEASEENNFQSSYVTVVSQGVDLRIKNITRTETMPGLSARFSVEVQNRGLAASGGFSVAFYPARFRAPALSDEPLQTRDIANLGSLASTLVTFDLPQQETQRGGESWFVLDRENGVSENDESNNHASSIWGVANDAMMILSPAQVTPAVASAGEPVTFSAAASDPNGDEVGYLWQLGDGTEILSGPSVGYTFPSPGFYTISLTITDGPFHSLVSAVSLEVVREIVDLGIVRKSDNRGRFKLLLPRPDLFDSRERVKSAVVEGDPGTKARYRNFKLSGTAKTNGPFVFLVEFLSTKTSKLYRGMYRYTVVD